MNDAGWIPGLIYSPFIALATWFFTYGLMQVYREKELWRALVFSPVLGAPVMALVIGVVGVATGRMHPGYFDFMAGVAIVVGLVAALKLDGKENRND